MTLNVKRVSSNNPDVAELSVRVQEVANAVSDFKIRQRLMFAVPNVTTLTPIVLGGNYGFQVGGVVIVAANRTDAADTPFACTAHWSQMPDGRISVTPVGLTASAKYQIVLEVIERG